MDQSSEEALANFELGFFWIERIVTVTLTFLWFHSDSGESIIFHYAASASAHVFFFTNAMFLLFLFFRTSIDLDTPHLQDPQDKDMKKSPSAEGDVFMIERVGMVLMTVTYLPLGLTYVEFFRNSRVSCIALFSAANLFYSVRFIFGCLNKKGDSYKNCSGGTNEIVHENGGGDRGHLAEEKVIHRSPFMSNFCRRNFAEEPRMKTQDYNDISSMTGLDDLGTETQDTDGLETETATATEEYDDNMELNDNIPELEEVEETEMGADTDSAMSFEMLNMQDNYNLQERIQELDQELRTEKRKYQKMVSFMTLMNMQVYQIRKEIQVLKKKLAIAEQKHLKKLEKVENKWKRKIKKVAEKYKEERRIWEEKKFDLVYKLSATASEAEVYYFQAQEREESNRELENEVKDLTIKLCAANASSEIYRSLLHDDLRSTLHN